MASALTSSSYTPEDLARFHESLNRAHMRGQWQNEAVRKNGDGGVWDNGSFSPKSGGEGHLWPWADVYRFLQESCEAVPEGLTSRRSIMFNNPGLARGTTNTINMGIQILRPGELAWAHRHSISALRFVISGDPGICTVVDGVRCPMETGDLILTPLWMWHDHRNTTSSAAVWLDVLDGPVIGMFNQVTFEAYGEKQQPIRNTAANGGNDSGKQLRFPWREAEGALLGLPERDLSPSDGFVHEYRDRKTGSSVLRTLGCRLHRLPPGFSGKRHRRISSAIYHVVRGEGSVVISDKEFFWKKGDCFVVPNWSWRRLENRSASDDAVLFSVHDTPLLEQLGLHREDLALRIGTNDTAQESASKAPPKDRQ